jgi:hypothetical protein
MIGQLEVDVRSTLCPIRDQGNRPTCLAQSVTAAHEYSLGGSVSLSAEYLHYFSTGGRIDRGCSIPDSIRSLENDGQPSERECPYFLLGPPVGWKPTTAVTVYKRASSAIATGIDAVSIALRERRTPVLGIGLPRSFYEPAFPWVIPAGGRSIARHAVVAVGLGESDYGPVILIRNSWGESWGDHGHAFLPADFLKKHLLDAFVLGGEA